MAGPRSHLSWGEPHSEFVVAIKFVDLLAFRLRFEHPKGILRTPLSVTEFAPNGADGNQPGTPMDDAGVPCYGHGKFFIGRRRTKNLP